MNNYSLKNKIIIEGVISGLIVLILLAAIVFALGLVKTRGEAFLDQKKTMENFYSDWRNFEKARGDYQKFSSEMAGYPILLNEKESVKLIEALENAARQSGLLQEISVLNPKPEEEKNSLKLQLYLRGSFPNLVKFLVSLENLTYLNNIKTINFNRFSQKDIEQNLEFKGLSAGDINASISLEAFLQK